MSLAGCQRHVFPRHGFLQAVGSGPREEQPWAPTRYWATIVTRCGASGSSIRRWGTATTAARGRAGGGSGRPGEYRARMVANTIESPGCGFRGGTVGRIVLAGEAAERVPEDAPLAWNLDGGPERLSYATAS